MKTRPDGAVKELVVRMTEANPAITARDISVATGIVLNSINTAARRMNLKFSTINQPLKPSEAVKFTVNNGMFMTAKEIAAKHGLKVRSVRQAAKTLEVALKPGQRGRKAIYSQTKEVQS